MENLGKKSSPVQEQIIKTTMSLIQRSNGFVENITIRDIAKEADIAVGLINYHFGSKANLIEICVQRIISNVMDIFSKTSNYSNKDVVFDITTFTTKVFDFLLNNAEISKISMLGDLLNPNEESNSSRSYNAILKALPEAKSDDIRKVKAFILLSCIQSAFLNRSISKNLVGFDLNSENDYFAFFNLIAKIVNI
ncbi:MAG TPA: TetR/AcrR family transcriptional regulator [Clostridia bacterium]|jgi:AcrR family transcriptional regulator|nr:TetR/AcrR family transcriptional regulator [Clostridia bacterium]